MAMILYSGSILALARKALERSKTDHDEAVVCLILSAASVEGFLNEAIELAAAQRGEPTCSIGKIGAELDEEHGKTSSKLRLMHYLFVGKRLDEGSQPYQDFALLVSIRNAIMHLRPDKVHWDPEKEPGREFDLKPHALVERLIKRKVVLPPPKQFAPFLQQCIRHPAVGLWGHNTAVRMRKFIAGMAKPGTGFRIQLSLHIELEKEVGA